MTTKKLAGAFGAGAICMGTLTFVIATGEPDKPKMPAMADMQDMPRMQDMPEMSAAEAEMQAWIELSQPNAHHEHLAKYVGAWDVDAWFKMDPNAPAMESTGSMTTKTLMDGRYTMSRFNMPEFMGGPFDGMAIMGYDNAKQKYVSTWIDSWSTGIMVSEGAMSSDGSKLIMMGSMAGPEGDETMKMVTEWHGDDTIVDTFYDLTDGEWNMHAKMTYTRKGHAHGG
ncbi:MAG: DUF1579 domain-containing protein [Phycisphaerales bacterium]